MRSARFRDRGRGEERDQAHFFAKKMGLVSFLPSSLGRFFHAAKGGVKGTAICFAKYKKFYLKPYLFISQLDKPKTQVFDSVHDKKIFANGHANANVHEVCNRLRERLRLRDRLRSTPSNR